MSRTELSAFIKAYDVRGTVPDQMNAEVCRVLGAAFAEVVALPEGADTVAVGHDMRPSSPELSQAFAEGLRDRGVDALLIGLCSTDGLYHASGALGVPGAMFTASHNPARYNGIKFCRAGARPVGQDSGLVDIRNVAQGWLDAGTHPVAANRGTLTERSTLADYATFLRSLVDLSGSRPLKVVVDAGNGMAGLTVPAVLGTAAGLAELPLEIIPLYFELDGTFPNHEANPLDPANIVDLQAAVLEHGADLGLAFDGDADRCFVVDEQGRGVSASAVTGLVAAREVAREVAGGKAAADVTIVHNVITSAAVPEVIAEVGATAVRTRVGHSFVKATMAEHQAVFGGEHSAHYYFRDFWFADTGMLAAMHVLAALGEQSGTLSALLDAYDRYPASGEINSTVADVAAVTARVRTWAQDQGAAIDEVDGLTATFEGAEGSPMWWFNLRPSNTEPLLRLNAEAGDIPTMERIRDAVLGLVRAQAPAEPASEPAQQPAAAGPAPALEPWLRQILRCPSCRAELRDEVGPTGGPELVCVGCGLAYRVDDGIPVLLIDEARRP